MLICYTSNMENGPSLGDILSAALNKKQENTMEKIVNFYHAAKALEWSPFEIVGALNAEQFDTLEKHILSAKSENKLQRVKLFSPFATKTFWQNNKIECIKLVRSCGEGSMFGLLESKNFCEGHGTLNVSPNELERLIGLFGRAAIDIF